MTKSRTSTRTPNKRVLAIDPGFDRMGVAVLEKEGGPRVLYSTAIVTSPRETRAERLLMIGSALRSLIIEWRPSDFAIETLYFNKNITSGIGVAEARGVAVYEASLAGLSIYEYRPQDIKIAVTGYGKAAKEDVEKMVGRLVILPPLVRGRKRLDDELDAVAIGLTHFAHGAARRLSTPRR